jgi:AraC-like ligand binding domain
MKSFETFAAEHRAAGFDEILERRWQPNTVIDTHTHAFSVQALVVQGEMWLTVGERTQHLRPGGRFQLDANVAHAERYGAEGATYWVARRNPKSP